MFQQIATLAHRYRYHGDGLSPQIHSNIKIVVTAHHTQAKTITIPNSPIQPTHRQYHHGHHTRRNITHRYLYGGQGLYILPLRHRYWDHHNHHIGSKMVGLVGHSHHLLSPTRTIHRSHQYRYHQPRQSFLIHNRLRNLRNHRHLLFRIIPPIQISNPL